MLKLQPPLVLQRAEAQLLRWTPSVAVTLRVRRGRVWVTRSGDAGDHFLDPGDVLQLAPTLTGRSDTAAPVAGRGQRSWDRRRACYGAAKLDGKRVNMPTPPRCRLQAQQPAEAS